MAGWRGTGAIAAAVGLGALLILVLADRTPPPIATGDLAPAFELPRLDGAPLSLAGLRGRVVLLNFWATWCPPCEQEMPAMQRLHRALADQPFELVAVSVDEDADAVKAFRERMGLDFPIALDPKRDVARAYQTYKYPESFLIDAQGRIVARFVGGRDWDTPVYVDQIRALMAPGASAPSAAR